MHITGREPTFSHKPKGRWKLSPRHLATLITNLPPDAISLAAAEQMLLSKEALVRYRGADLLARRGDRDARLIMERHLREGRAVTRASVARRLNAFSWFSVEPLLAVALRDGDPRVRESAVVAIGNLATHAAFALLTHELLTETDDMVLLAIPTVVRRHNNPDAVDALGLAMGAEDPEVRVVALEALGENGASATTAYIEPALYDDEAIVLDAAAQSYVEIRRSEALPLIIERIRHTENQHRLALLRGMHQATNRLFINLAAVSCRDELLNMLEMTGADWLDATRLRTVMCLAWMQHEHAYNLLETIIENEQDESIKQEMHHIVYSLRGE